MFRCKLRVSSDAYMQQAKLNEKLVAKGIQAFLFSLLVHNIKKQNQAIELFEETFRGMKKFREQIRDDGERLSVEAKEQREHEAAQYLEQQQNEREL